MKIPRFWEKQSAERTDSQGNIVRADGWGWSQHNIEEAREKAAQTAERVVQWLIGGSVSELNHYGYEDRLPREEIIDEYQDEHGEPAAFVSRNGYGALILNTQDLMFIDIDFPPRARQRTRGFLSLLFGKSETPDINLEAETLTEIRATAARYSDYGFRVYRTFNGYRLMLANRRFSADSEQAIELLEAFHTDPLYVRMCRNQQCFRARLTPKTWRCNIESPPSRFPFQDDEAEKMYRKWESLYIQGVDRFSTCRYVESVGPHDIDVANENFITIHDLLSKANSSDPLA